MEHTMNILEWAITVRLTTVDENHEANGCGFDTVYEHSDGSWIGVVNEPTDNNNANYWVHAGNFDNFFEKLTDAQVALWNHHAKPSDSPAI
jgi:hypothetical protein